MNEPLRFNGVDVREENGELCFSVAGDFRVLPGASIVVNGQRGLVTRHAYMRDTAPRTTTISFLLS